MDAWARSEPQALSEKVALLRRFRGQFDLGTDFVMGMFERDESDVVGGTGLHKRRGAHALEIGVLDPNQPCRQRPGHGVDCVPDAGCLRALRRRPRRDPRRSANEQSIADPAQARVRRGGDLRRRLPPDEKGVPRDVIVFSLFRDEFAGSPASSVPVRAFDAAGERVL